MRNKATNRISNKLTGIRLEEQAVDGSEMRWLFLGMKVMDELRVLARLARPAVKR